MNNLSEVAKRDIQDLFNCGVPLPNGLSSIHTRDVNEKYGLDWEQQRLVKEKLTRCGLLARKNDAVRDDDLNSLVEYLQKVEADNKKRTPHGVKLPNSIRKLSGQETYSLTKLGRDFLKMIED